VPSRARELQPRPGQGPSKAARDAGFYDILFIGQTSDGRSLRVSVRGDKDPGYGSTSKMIAESGICLARDISHDAVGGGFRTTASAMGELLIARLQAGPVSRLCWRMVLRAGPDVVWRSTRLDRKPRRASGAARRSSIRLSYSALLMQSRLALPFWTSHPSGGPDRSASGRSNRSASRNR
jgi:hypothetical protein